MLDYEHSAFVMLEWNEIVILNSELIQRNENFSSEEDKKLDHSKEVKKLDRSKEVKKLDRLFFSFDR